MLGAYVFAQKDVTKFLGIPVDGTKTEMVQKLEAKGFKYDNTYDWLEGEFNGREVFLSIVTNNNKVWRVMVQDRWPMDEADIKIRFNNLCRQFAKNEKYLCLNKEPEIDENEDIRYEMMVNHKRYQSSYVQLQVPLSELLAEEIIRILSETDFDKDTVDSLFDSKKEEVVQQCIDYITEKCLKKSVWFMIDKKGGEYKILMYYDNEYNHADGEDL